MRKKNIPIMPATRNSRARYDVARLRSANSRSGVIGDSARRSMRTNAASRTTPTTNATIVLGRRSSRRGGADEAVDQRRPCPRVEVSAPVRSKCPGSRAVSVITEPAEDEHDDADRHVDEQHPSPRHPLDEHAAGDQAERRCRRPTPRCRGRSPGCVPGPRRTSTSAAPGPPARRARRRRPARRARSAARRGFWANPPSSEAAVNSAMPPDEGACAGRGCRRPARRAAADRRSSGCRR